MSEDTNLGPFAREDLFHELRSQVEEGLSFKTDLGGIEVIEGGQFDEETNSMSPLVVHIPTNQVPFGLNFSDDPAVLSQYEDLNPDQVESSNILFREEIFGPVLPITSYPQSDIDLGVFIANSTEYGLGSSIIGKDLKVAE